MLLVLLEGVGGGQEARALIVNVVTRMVHRLSSLVTSFLLRQERFFLSDGYTVMVVFETAKCAHWIIGVVIKGGVTDVARA